MNFQEFKETFKISVEAMRSNKMRSFLASLGVVIGISFVILMGWILTGLDNAVQDTFDMIGTDMLYVDKWDWAGGKNWREVRQRKDIDLQQAEDFISRINFAEETFINSRLWQSTIKYKNEDFSGISVTGTNFQHGRTPAGEVQLGRYFTEFEEYNSENVAVIGHNVWKAMFPKGGGIGETIKVNGHKFLVIGVIEKRGTLFLDFIDNQLFIPLTTFMGKFGKSRRSLSIGVKAGGEENLDFVRDETRGKMRIVRNLKPWEEDDFSINETKAFEKNTANIRLAVWGVGIGMTVLSFVVGIIGIMNIMFVSVTERTKEIGIRKAIGAKKSSILLQFITESALLSFIGALIAFVLCSGLIYATAIIAVKYEPKAAFLSPYMPYELLIIASVVSIFVGILAGFIPALRASNLNPVDAIRSE